MTARQELRRARASLRKTIRMARALARSNQMTVGCRKTIVQDVRALRKAIPRGRRLKRCLATAG